MITILAYVSILDNGYDFGLCIQDYPDYSDHSK